jgi:hypothetical protein
MISVFVGCSAVELNEKLLKFLGENDVVVRHLSHSSFDRNGFSVLSVAIEYEKSDLVLAKEYGSEKE